MTLRTLVPWYSGRTRTGSELSPFFTTGREMSRLFDEFRSMFEAEPFMKLGTRPAAFVPSVDVEDRDDALVVTAELPGMDEKDVDITLNRDSLCIRGEKRTEHETKEGKGGHYIERSYGAFERIIPLMSDIDEDKIDASFKKGMLTVKLPKTAEAKAKAKKISVKT